MVKKNPNLYSGIILRVNKVSSVPLPLPCQRLSRRLSELLETAKVRSTDYIFTLTGVGKLQVDERPAVTVTQMHDTTLEFDVKVFLPNGEFFVGSLKAPVKCRDDGLWTELSRAVNEINDRGWHKEKVESEKKPMCQQSQVSENERLARRIDAYLDSNQRCREAIDRDIAIRQKQIDDLTKASKELTWYKEILRNK